MKVNMITASTGKLTCLAGFDIRFNSTDLDVVAKASDRPTIAHTLVEHTHGATIPLPISQRQTTLLEDNHMTPMGSFMVFNL
jgi:hypothetical protein